MDKDALAILKTLKSKKYSPVYFFTGDEPYYIDILSDFVEENVLKEEEKGFNLIVLYGKDVDTNAIVQNCRRFPMMSDYQVVIVKEAQEISDFNKEEGQAILSHYFKKPSPSTILVFNYKYKKFDLRKSIAKEIAKIGILYNSKKIYDTQLEPWIESHIKDSGFRINPKAKILLGESIGADLSRLANEIKKVTINLPKGEEITEELIQKYIGISKDFNVFELQKWLSYKNPAKVYNIVNYFGENPKNNPIVLVLINLFTYFSKLLLAYEYKIRSEKEAQEKLGVNYYTTKDFVAAIRNYSYPKTLEIIDAIEKADLQSKGIGANNISEKEIYKELTYKILH